ncbi:MULTISPECIES: hypothetical protein [Maribacter]|uniref:Uncharacterized protein n=1 Tax=Maribacter flavus TaxID=1658664 RepID=A0A5B2U0Q0_9FLAO|nr:MULTISPECIES: hypothetical protein [Maribacter]KAA2219943.1 hypothetical protein F0361_10255 [Maribacter flavus]MDC6405159.1 hypothetical protein [Maribacter sp. PR66]MEE1972034.1 hypothetical protein [Maribacter flavus]
MNNKIKSLIYLSCFIIAAVFYHFQINGESSQLLPKNAEMAKADIVVEPFTENMATEAVQ